MSDPIGLEILWGRLIGVTDEVATSMMRTSFSVLVREMNDFAVVLTDPAGNSIVQNTITIPVFIGTVPHTVKQVLKRYPAEDWAAGDVLITNDPYLASGHKNDVTIVTPVFKESTLVGFMGNVAHWPDIGGALMSRGARETYEEGLHIPPTMLYRGGRPNETLFEILRTNVRVHEQVLGDLEAQVVGNQIGARRLVELMDELGLGELQTAGAEMQQRCERAMRAAIDAIPDGVYRYEVHEDGVDEPLHFKISVEVRGDDILVDYAGTSRQQDYGVNSTLNYTYAYTAYPLKCVLIPELPNNEGCFRPIRVTAPLGSILNPSPPAPLAGRSITGHVLQGAVFGALHPVLPDRVLAETGAPTYATVMTGQDDRGRRYAQVTMNNGGMGAQAGLDGQSAVCFPANVRNTPVEVLESLIPVRVLARELIPDSGGLGEHRGGLGQRVRYRVLGTNPMVLTVLCDRRRFAPQGLAGGGPGRTGQVTFDPPHDTVLKGPVVLKPGDEVTLEVPGGGGYGDPRRRAPDLVARDLREGYCTTWPDA